jgi:hypothetical protein
MFTFYAEKSIKVISHFRLSLDRTPYQLQRFSRKREHVRLAIPSQSRIELARHGPTLTGHSQSYIAAG